jgi:hypothetical protein
MGVYYVISRTKQKERDKLQKINQEMGKWNLAYCTTVTVEQQVSQNSGLGMANNIRIQTYKFSSIPYLPFCMLWTPTSLFHNEQVIVIPCGDRSTERA